MGEQQEQQQQRRRMPRSRIHQLAQEETAPVMPPKAPSPIVEGPEEEDTDLNDLSGWMRSRGFGQHTEALMSIGVETAEDLSLVTREDLTDLKIDDETATLISNEISKMED